jgi:uncharacterized protein YecE (DUF72 family)
MNIRVGTSGWSYKEWKGHFYPEKLAAKDMLRFYGERFGAVEVNNTFYRMPKAEVLAGWAADVPDSFAFAVKASKRITHDRRLADVADSVDHLLGAARALGPKLGPFLIQLPPNFKKDVPRLHAFLDLLQPPERAAFEFRHASWFDDQVYAALRARGHAWCVADTGEAGDPPFVATAEWGYLRLRRVAYGEADLQAWADRIRGQEWSEAFVFFKHEDEATGPKLASRFLERWGDAPVGRGTGG